MKRLILIILTITFYSCFVFSQTNKNAAPWIKGIPTPQKVKAGIPEEKPLYFTYNFTNYSVAEGLSQSNINCIFVDSRQIIWIGTYAGGLNKFDGEKFTHYTKKDGLSDNIIWKILEDKEGNLWMASDNGLMKYNGKTFTQVLDTADLGTQYVRSIYMTDNETIWIATARNGAFHYDYKNDSLLLHLTPEDLGGENFNHVWDLCEDKSGNIWLSINRKGLVKFNPSKKLGPNSDACKNYSAEKDSLGGNVIIDVFCDTDGNIWATTGKGITKFDGKKFKNYTTDDGLISNSNISIYQAKNGEIYFGSYNNGVSIYSNELGFHQTISPYKGMAGLGISSICEDANGNFWFGTQSDGISKFEGKTFRHFYPDALNPKLKVYCSYEDIRGNLWAGTSEGLYFSNGKTLMRYTTEQGLSNNIIWCMDQDKNGDFWIGTDKGLNRFDGTYFYHYFKEQPNGISDNTIKSIVVAKNGTIWMATNWGVNSIINGEVAVYSEQQGIAYYYTEQVFEDSRGNIWIGTYGGGFSYLSAEKTRLDTNQFINFSAENDLVGNNNVHFITEDREGNIWASSFGESIDILKSNWKEIKDPNEWFVHLNYENGLLNSNIEFMVEDDRGDMWLGTVNGVDKITKAAQSVKSGKFEVTHYGHYDGFKGVESNRHGCLKDSKGYLWFSADNLVTRYNPDESAKESIEPKTQITDVRLFFNKVDWDTIAGAKFSSLTSWYFLPENLVLPYDQNHLSFDFIGISHTMSKNVRYKWKLLNFDEDWCPETEKHEAVYSNLPPGEFEFQVMAKNAEGIWNENPVVFKFKIRPPFWATWWFRISITVLLIVLFVGLFMWRTKALRKRQRILENTVTERTAEVVAQKEIIEEKHKEITDSINYAERIQRSFLATKSLLDENLGSPDLTPALSEGEGEGLGDSGDCGYFVFFQPKDVVSGDFYWASKLSNGNFALVTADSTGHGVPGAIMSILNISSLEKSVEMGLTNPADIFNHTRQTIISRLKKDGSKEGGKDGMDASLICFDFENKKFTYAAANNPIWVIRKSELIELSPDKMPIGKHDKDQIPFTQNEFVLQTGDVVYTLTDGLPDQFGGVKGKKFMYKKLKEMLISISQEPMEIQKEKLHSAFVNWKGELEQVDDVCLIGVRI